MKKIKLFSSIAVLSMSLLFSINVSASENINIDRLAGQNRYETSSKIINKGWLKSDYVILVNGENYPDALSASVLAKKYNAPILLTTKDSLPNETMEQLKRLKPITVICIGGTGVISDNVSKQVTSLGSSFERHYSGQNRFETSVKIAKSLGRAKGVFIVNGQDGYEDALFTSSVASNLSYPIVLTTKNTIPDVVKDYLSKVRNDGGEIIAVGGTDVINSEVINELNPTKIFNQSTKYDRNIALINNYKDKLHMDSIYIASDKGFADALSGSALAGKNNNPIVLVGDSNQGTINNFIKDNNNVKNINILGGISVISDTTIKNISMLGSENIVADNTITSNITNRTYKLVDNLYISKTEDGKVSEEQFNNFLKFTNNESLYYSILSISSDLVYHGNLNSLYFNITDNMATFSCVKDVNDDSSKLSFIYDKTNKTLTLIIKNIDINSRTINTLSNAFPKEFKSDVITDITNNISSEEDSNKTTNYGSATRYTENNITTIVCNIE